MIGKDIRPQQCPLETTASLPAVLDGPWHDYPEYPLLSHRGCYEADIMAVSTWNGLVFTATDCVVTGGGHKEMTCDPRRCWRAAYVDSQLTAGKACSRQTGPRRCSTWMAPERSIYAGW